jgi:hypothetical protein
MRQRAVGVRASPALSLDFAAAPHEAVHLFRLVVEATAVWVS